MKITISAKCNDMFGMLITDDKNKTVLDYDGYVPDIESIGGGDYIELEIDNATGTIIGWVPLTEKTIAKITDSDD